MSEEKPEWWPSDKRIDYLFDKLEGKADFTQEEADELARITEYRREVAVLDGDKRKYALTGMVLDHLKRIQEVEKK